MALDGGSTGEGNLKREREFILCRAGYKANVEFRTKLNRLSRHVA
jgi:hypothetical protein